MYILFNEQGNITTCIPHGQVVRQGNDFDVYVCFPNRPEYLNLRPTIQYSDGESYKLVGVQSSPWGEPGPAFKRHDPNESIFEFKEGSRYITYHVAIPDSYGVTANYGKVDLLVSVYRDGDAIYQGNATVNVVKTYGSTEVDTVSLTEYQKLLSYVRENTTVFTFPFVEENGVDFDSDVLILAWTGAGTVYGKIDFPSSASYNDWTEVGSMDAATVKLREDITFFGRDEEGSDVEFRLITDPADGHLSLQIHAGDYSNATASFLAPCSVALSTYELYDEEHDSYDVTGFEVGSVAFTADPGESTVTLSWAGEGSGSEKLLRFDFVLEKPDKGDKGDSGNTPYIGANDHWFIGNEDTGVVARGQDGQDGQNGQDGTAATITIKSVTTGNPGTNANVVNSGTQNAAELDFTIPRGADGVVSTTNGTIGFQVNSSGQLVAYAPGSAAPDMTINSSGQLIYNY